MSVSNQFVVSGRNIIYSPIFQVNSTLEVLDISWNGLGYEGAVVLSKCLKANKGLRDLDVSNNRLDWRCSPLIAEGLRQSSTISKLKVKI